MNESSIISYLRRQRSPNQSLLVSRPVVTFLDSGVHNSTFKVVSRDRGSLCLRAPRTPGYELKNDYQQEAKTLAQISRLGISPELVHIDLLENCLHRPVILTGYLSGSRFDSSFTQIVMAASALSCLHRSTMSCHGSTCQGNFALRLWNAAQSAMHEAPKVCLGNSIAASWHHLQQRMQQLMSECMNTGEALTDIECVVHGDTSRHNWRFLEKAVLLDWSDSRLDSPIFDVMNFLFCPTTSKSARSHFLDAYFESSGEAIRNHVLAAFGSQSILSIGRFYQLTRILSSAAHLSVPEPEMARFVLRAFEVELLRVIDMEEHSI